MKRVLFFAIAFLTSCSSLDTLGAQDKGSAANQPPGQPNIKEKDQEVRLPAFADLPSAKGLNWDWQLSASDQEINKQIDGFSKQSKPLNLIDVDGFGIKANTVAKLKAKDIYTVCYLNVGSWEPWRPDAKDYPKYLFIHRDPNWPDEIFLDIRDVFKPNSVLAKILKKRIKMCKDKGFDAVEPDNMQNHENTSGKITQRDQVNFNTWFADQVHAQGLAILQKNGPDLVLLKDDQGRRMVDVYDGILNESCAKYNECAPLKHYVDAGKLALDVEYRASDLKCHLAKKYGFRMLYKDLYLTSPSSGKYKRQSCSE